MGDRGVAPVVGVITLIGITVLLGVSVAYLVSFDPPSASPHVVIDGTIDAEENRIMLEHAGGDTLPVTELDIRVFVDDEPIRHQPPVPFTNTTGFTGFPSGPLNARSSNTWAPGARTAFTLATTNDPLPTQTSAVIVQISQDGSMIAEVELTHVS